MAHDHPDQNRPDQAGPLQDASPLPDNVIPLPRPRGDGRFPHIAMVEAYWLALRGRRIVPRRSDIDPRGIESSLEQAFIAEMIAPGLARVRIAGAHLTRLMGMEVRGMPLSALFVPQARDELAMLLHDMTRLPQMMQLSLQADAGMGKPPLEARMLLLPMRGDTDAIDRMLGCLATDGVVGISPRRFAITARRITPLTPPPQDAWQHYARPGPAAGGPRHPKAPAAQQDGARADPGQGPGPGMQDAATPFRHGPRLRVITPQQDEGQDAH